MTSYLRVLRTYLLSRTFRLLRTFCLISCEKAFSLSFTPWSEKGKRSHNGQSSLWPCVGIIPHPIYYQEHHRRFDFSAHNPDMDRMYELLLAQGQKMLTTGVAMKNQPDWGLANHTFSEVCL